MSTVFDQGYWAGLDKGAPRSPERVAYLHRAGLFGADEAVGILTAGYPDWDRKFTEVQARTFLGLLREQPGEAGGG